MHDAKNRPLKVGDQVLVPAVVENVSAGDDYCNVSIKTTYGRRPDGQKERMSAINTGVLLRSNEGDTNDLADAFAAH